MMPMRYDFMKESDRQFFDLPLKYTQECQNRQLVRREILTKVSRSLIEFRSNKQKDVVGVFLCTPLVVYLVAFIGN